MKCYLPEALDFAFIYCAITKVHSLYSISILCQPNQIITAFFKLLSSIQTKHITPFLSTLKTTAAIWPYDINMPCYFFQSYLFCLLLCVREGCLSTSLSAYMSSQLPVAGAWAPSVFREPFSWPKALMVVKPARIQRCFSEGESVPQFLNTDTVQGVLADSSLLLVLFYSSVFTGLLFFFFS